LRSGPGAGVRGSAAPRRSFIALRPRPAVFGFAALRLCGPAALFFVQGPPPYQVWEHAKGPRITGLWEYAMRPGHPAGVRVNPNSWNRRQTRPARDMPV
jgi:hypothetical protein